MKQEVKEEVAKDAHLLLEPKIGDEAVSCRRRLRTKVKAEIKREDHDWQRPVTGLKRELVDEAEQMCVKEEQAQAGPIQDAKRRRISQKRSDTSVPPIESRLAEWAEKCLAFQSSGKTINWNRGEQAWHACCAVGGKTRNMRFRPKDFSAKEVEKAWKQAVAWRKQQEKERERIEQSQKRKR
eukprot:s3112_g9.t1